MGTPSEGSFTNTHASRRERFIDGGSASRPLRALGDGRYRLRRAARLYWKRATTSKAPSTKHVGAQFFLLELSMLHMAQPSAWRMVNWAARLRRQCAAPMPLLARRRSRRAATTDARHVEQRHLEHRARGQSQSTRARPWRRRRGTGNRKRSAALLRRSHGACRRLRRRQPSASALSSAGEEA